MGVPTTPTDFTKAKKLHEAKRRMGTRANAEAAFGKDAVTDDPRAPGTSKWICRLDKRKDPKAIGKLKEYKKEVTDLSVEMGFEANAQVAKRVMRDQRGEQVLVPEFIADDRARRGGLKDVKRPQGRHIVRGPDGMLFTEQERGRGDWWPTGRTCLGTPLSGDGVADVTKVQEDPDGGLWLYDDTAERWVSLDFEEEQA